MGAWGPGNFENDEALDFIDALAGEEGAAAIIAQLREADAQPEGELDADTAARALAAAELVALSLGRGSKTPPESLPNVAQWNWKPSTNDIALSLRVVTRVGEDSELGDLWEESEEDFNAWASELEDLTTRLGGAN